MREAGLRFSTLGTNRYRVAYKLYQQHGYEDMQVLAASLTNWKRRTSLPGCTPTRQAQMGMTL